MLHWVGSKKDVFWIDFQITLQQKVSHLLIPFKATRVAETSVPALRFWIIFSYSLLFLMLDLPGNEACGANFRSRIDLGVGVAL